MTELIVLVPTRGRPHHVKPIIDAWYKTAAFDVAKLRFIVDYDDPEFERYHAEIQQFIPAEISVASEWQPLVPKLNRAARLAALEANIVAFMGDDHLPRTSMWAHQLVRYGLTRWPSIHYGQDGFKDERLPTWWSMTSDIIGALDGMVPAPVQHLYCDNVVKDIGLASGTLHYLPGILIEHMHPATGKVPGDAQHVRVNRDEQYVRDGSAYRRWLRDGFSSAIEQVVALKDQ